MKYKALSNDFCKDTNKIFSISLIIGFVMIAALLALFYQQINSPDFEPTTLFYYIIPYFVLSYPNMMFLGMSTSQKNIIKTIGRDRYITFNHNALVLEDNIGGRNIARTYAWEDIKRILVQNNTPFEKFNKNKTYTIMFIVDNQAYECVQKKGISTSGAKRLGYLDVFFSVMYSDEIINEIKTYWNGTIEDER